MKVLSLFSGIGAFEKALKRLKINYELIGFSEIDKYAIKSYCAIHDEKEEKNLGDITKIDIGKLPKDIDLLTHGSPCQNFSIAGKQGGGDIGSGTSSSLMWYTVDIIRDTKPKYIIWENVKNLLSKKHRHNFDGYIEVLNELGYNSYYQILNAKDYGIPQNRERIFTVSIRKDIDKNNFKFPEKQALKLRLKDLLEDDVEEKYYMSEEITKKIQSDLINKNTLMIDLCQWRREGHPREYNDISPTLSSRDYKEPRCIQVAQMYGTEREPNPQAGRIYDSEGISPTIDSCSGGNRMPKVIQNERAI